MKEPLITSRNDLLLKTLIL